MPAPKKPQDHKAKAEARRDSIEVVHDGVTYTITRERADDLELLELVEDEKYISAIRGYLGVDQWKAFKDAHRTESGAVPAAAFNDFLDAAMEAIGGNSSASPTS